MRRGVTTILVGVACAVALKDLHAWVTDGWAWAPSTVPYYVNTSSDVQNLGSTAILNDLQKAAAVWPTQAGINLHLQYAGPTTISTIGLDGTNVIFFRNDTSPYGYMAETYFWADSTSHLIESDTVWHEGAYKYYTGSSGCTAGGQYLGPVAVHEFGHTQGMLHSTVTTAVMYATVSVWCDQAAWTLTSDDIAGIRSLYPLVSAPPAAPSQLVVGASSSNPTGSLNLSWKDNTTNASGYRVQQSSDGVTFAQIAQLGSAAVSYASSGLASGATYYYRVDAFNGSGTSSYTNTASGKTQAPAAPTAPAAPSSPSPASGATGVSITPTLSWVDTGATSYKVYLNGALYKTVTATNVTVGTLPYNTTESWSVVAVNSYGSTSGATWKFTTRTSRHK